MLDRNSELNRLDNHNNETYQRLLEAAGKLFSKRGYAGVTLRDIANEVGMRQASLYYYAPNGKEQLFIEVMKRDYTRHRQGLEQAIAASGANLTTRLQAVAGWLLSQPPVDYTRINFSDAHTLDAKQAEWLIYFANSSIVEPIKAALEDAIRDGSIIEVETEIIANCFVSIIEGLHNVPETYTKHTRLQLANIAIELVLNGLLKR